MPKKLDIRPITKKRFDLSRINFQMTYHLGGGYEGTRERAFEKLAKYWEYPNLVTFDDGGKCITFTTERLIPMVSTGCPRVMLLFSNPHPHSVRQGMFLSPSTKGQQNLFWPVMVEAGWFSGLPRTYSPAQLARIFIRGEYEGPFELLFYWYYAFPTDFPEDIRRIFGSAYFNAVIEPQAADEFRKIIRETGVEAVVSFNKGVFNLVSPDPVDRYIQRLNSGELVASRVKGIDRIIPVFLTYPTGWRYHREFLALRKDNVQKIREAILAQKAQDVEVL